MHSVVSGAIGTFKIHSMLSMMSELFVLHDIYLQFITSLYCIQWHTRLNYGHGAHLPRHQVKKSTRARILNANKACAKVLLINRKSKKKSERAPPLPPASATASIIPPIAIGSVPSSSSHAME